MRPIDLMSMISLLRSPCAPAMLCQGGYVLVNTNTLSRHPDLIKQLNERVEKQLLQKLEQCSGKGVDVFSMIQPARPAARIQKEERSRLFKLNT